MRQHAAQHATCNMATGNTATGGSLLLAAPPRVSKMNKELFLLLNLIQAVPFAYPAAPCDPSLNGICCSNGFCRVADAGLLWHFSGVSQAPNSEREQSRETQLDDVVRRRQFLLLLLHVARCTCGNVIELSPATSFDICVATKRISGSQANATPSLAPALSPTLSAQVCCAVAVTSTAQRYANAAARYFGIHKIL